MTGDEVIAALALEPHPEGGWFRQTWIAEDGPRPSGTCIYFLLRAGERSHWHKVDATEVWHFYTGAPLVLRQAVSADGPAEPYVLGSDLANGAFPQVIVPEGVWQSAETMGDWTLVGCTVSPAFQFSGFELAPPEFDIPDR